MRKDNEPNKTFAKRHRETDANELAEETEEASGQVDGGSAPTSAVEKAEEFERASGGAGSGERG